MKKKCFRRIAYLNVFSWLFENEQQNIFYIIFIFMRLDIVVNIVIKLIDLKRRIKKKYEMVIFVHKKIIYYHIYMVMYSEWLKN